MTISCGCVPTRSTPGFPCTRSRRAMSAPTRSMLTNHRFASMPLHVLHADGSRVLARRQRTSDYTIASLKKAARHLLGYPHPRRVSRGVYAEQAIGISTDEITRAKDSDVAYLRNVFPLIDWDRRACAGYLAERWFRAHSDISVPGMPIPWEREVAMDPRSRPRRVARGDRIRQGHPPRLPHATQQGQALRGQYFLHRFCRPVDHADLDPPPRPGDTCDWSVTTPPRLLTPTGARRGPAAPAHPSTTTAGHDHTPHPMTAGTTSHFHPASRHRPPTADRPGNSPVRAGMAHPHWRPDHLPAGAPRRPLTAPHRPAVATAGWGNTRRSRRPR
jgi:hypothetical protein